MQVDKFGQSIEALRLGVTTLLQQTEASPLPPQALLDMAFAELDIALEELRVAELELYQQNLELANIHMLLAAERQRYQELFESAPDGYLVTDPSGVIQRANCAAATLLNVKQDFLVGKPLVIFIADEEHKAFYAYLTHLQQIDQVGEKEVCLQPRNDVCFDAALTVTAVRNQSGQPIALRWLLRDITERKRVESALQTAKTELEIRVKQRTAELAEANQRLLAENKEHQKVESQLLHNAFHDVLTGLPNRALFMEHLRHAFEYYKRHRENLFAVLFLDLDCFKVVNDNLGHICGDQFLITIAQRLKACLRPSDTIARFGGDEFTILLEDIKDVSDTIQVADRIQRELALPFELCEQEVFTTASIGIAFATNYERPEDLLRDADTAMYRAKALGKARYQLFNMPINNATDEGIE